MVKEPVAGIMLTLLLTSMLAIAFNIQPVRASGTIYIRADGSIDPPDAPISTFDNVTYILTGNITADADGIVVERDNIVVDGAGYTVQGWTESGNGIDLTETVNVTIKRANIRGFSHGICLNSTSQSILSGNSITNNGGGITLYNSAGNSISGNNITVNNGTGIYITESSNNSVFQNNLTQNDCGIYFYSANNNSIVQNNFLGNAHQIEGEYFMNIWDNSYPSGGNYWSDYNGTDANDDGIGDTAYVISENNKDVYPLMHPYVRILGDVNYDRIVDIYDAIILAGAFDSGPGSSKWNSNADINGDNTIDIYDAILLASNFGKTA